MALNLDDLKIGEVHTIGFTRRVGANIIDGIIISMLTLVVVVLLGLFGVLFGMYRTSEEITGEWLIVISAAIVSVLYFVGSWASTGQTVGHTALTARVALPNGGKLSVGRAILRYIGYVISSLVLGIGFLWIIFDPRNRGWHDKLAGSVVVDPDDEFAGDKTTFVPAAPGAGKGWLVVWLILLIVAPAATTGGILILGPAVKAIVKQVLGK
jgi:uncharacterized RDD family membrane protein YckC